ncbi:MAG: dethiobiotin synthase [Legionellaceae bacterium]|nr:dethiobiotin synthase [Legionellaceae bacterium]
MVVERRHTKKNQPFRGRPFFVIGTDTDVGKTFVTSQLLQQCQREGIRAAGLKLVATGALFQKGRLISEDALHLQRYSAVSWEPGWVFRAPIAPHIAAEQVGVSLSVNAIQRYYKKCVTAAPVEQVFIEGAGGLLVPLNAKETWVDVIRKLQAQVILVVPIRLGCINHALLTDRVLQEEGLTVHGWIANACEPATLHPEEIVQSLQTRMRASYLGQINRQV